ncbi:MAG: type III-B CRISPR-associated protein Cas10/Cmr2 [Sulfuricellaceae bacterium]
MSYFHFTLGPVQGFVAQARRTRDFWAGSFILSWLSAVAMKAVGKQGGDMVFPKPDESFMRLVENGGEGSKQGCIPNRFMAKVDEGFDPRQVALTVQTAWRALAGKVWECDLQGIADEKTEKVWERQIAAFWDIEWALTADADATDTLDCLKYRRTHLPPDEEGEKCMMMDGWQELSGAARPGEKPKKFWEKVRASRDSTMATDLRPNEMLCAIAFVKRRFVRCFKDVSATLPGGWTVQGWPLPSGVPSVHYMAAAPWLAQLIAKAKEDSGVEQALWDFHDDAYQLTGSYGEWDSNITCIRAAIDKGAERKWAALDGAVFFDAMLENKNLWGEKAEDAIELLAKLKTLRRLADIDPVSPFYAVLLMDGDELGIQMSEPSKRPAIAQGLAQFTGGVAGIVEAYGVADIVEAYNGFLVYAGGDDVLALLPLECALECAAALREHYLACFAPPVATSISAAIEYAHVKMPLGKVLGDAHDLLNEVAKDGRGRDAIACRVWKPGGMALEWAMPWEIALEDGRVVIEWLAEEFRQNRKIEEAEGEAGRFSGKFFHRIGERFDLLRNCPLIISRSMPASRLPPLQGEGWGGDGVNAIRRDLQCKAVRMASPPSVKLVADHKSVAINDSLPKQPHPHPNPPLEGEGASILATCTGREVIVGQFLNPHRGETPILDNAQAVSLMAMEYLNSGASTAKTMDEARKIVQPLLEQCCPTLRKRNGEETTFEPQPLDADGALLVRFLAQKGVGR